MQVEGQKYIQLRFTLNHKLQRGRELTIHVGGNLPQFGNVHPLTRLNFLKARELPELTLDYHGVGLKETFESDHIVLTTAGPGTRFRYNYIVLDQDREIVGYSEDEIVCRQITIPEPNRKLPYPQSHQFTVLDGEFNNQGVAPPKKIVLSRDVNYSSGADDPY